MRFGFEHTPFVLVTPAGWSAIADLFRSGAQNPASTRSQRALDDKRPTAAQALRSGQAWAVRFWPSPASSSKRRSAPR